MSFHLARRLFSTVSHSSTLPSFTRGLFRGHLATESVHPYPPQDVLNIEEGDTLKMLVEPSRHFFSKVNDAAANDDSASIPEKTYAGLRELGAYGMQVSEFFKFPPFICFLISACFMALHSSPARSPSINTERSLRSMAAWA